MLLGGRGGWSWDAGTSNTWRHSSPNQLLPKPWVHAGAARPQEEAEVPPTPPAPSSPSGTPVFPRTEESQGSQVVLPHDVSIRAVHRPIYIRTSRLEPSIISL